jgi:hypothetical protein
VRRATGSAIVVVNGGSRSLEVLDIALLTSRMGAF